MSDEQPPPRPTVSLPAVPQWAIEMMQATKAGIAEIRADVADARAETRADVGLVSNDLGLLKTRVSIIESLRVEDEARTVKLSGGVRGLSSSDLAHEARIAELGTKVDDLAKTNATQLAILSRLDKVASNPVVKTIVTILVTILGTWAASKGITVK